MEFSINVKQFTEYLTPAADVALKNTVKDHSSEGLIHLSAYMETLTIRAFGGSAAVKIKLRQPDGYEYIYHGQACIYGKELMDTLKSFPPSEELVVCTQGDKLQLSIVSAEHDHVGIPIFTNPPELTELAETYDQEVSVNREYFVKGLNQLKYAPATDEKMFSYMCVLMECSANTLRFGAGSGGRFATVEYSGQNQSISSGDAVMIIPKDNIPNIIRILKKVPSETIEIKSLAENQEDNEHRYLSLTTDNLTIYVFGIEQFISYPDLSKIIEYNFPYQIPIQTQDWKYVAESIKAGRDSLCHPIHYAKIVMDMQHGYLDLQTNTSMKMNRRVYFEPHNCVIDTTKDESHRPWFCCNADCLIEISQQYKKKKTFTFNFECQSILDAIPDDEPKQMKPILVKFPDEIDKNEVTEKSSVFFTVSNRWDDSDWIQEYDEIDSRFDILDI